MHSAKNNLNIFEPCNRLILLGASNLTLSLRLVIQLMQQRLGGPSEIMTAIGHGRAYGLFSQALGRGLPGIADCGLWQQLESMTARPTAALLTDIGNDILYGLSSQQILQTVERCIDRLQRQSAQIIVTNLPMASIENLSQQRYTFFRNIFYPSSRMSRIETVRCAHRVHEGLKEMALRRRFQLYEQKPVWFGLDGIHVNFWQRKAFYQDIVRQFPRSDGQLEFDGNENRLWLGWQRRPEFAYKTLLGRAIYRPQPSGRLSDGSYVCKC